MTKNFENEIDALVSTLGGLDVSRIVDAKELKENAFALLKVSESFDEYLPKINGIHFESQRFLYNSGHHAIRDNFENGKAALISLLLQVKREAHYGALKKKLLPTPEQVTVGWLLRNCSMSFWFGYIVVLAVVFICGSVMENKFGVGAKIAPWVLDPIDSLKSEAALPKK